MLSDTYVSRAALRDAYAEALDEKLAELRQTIPDGDWQGVPAVLEGDFPKVRSIFDGEIPGQSPKSGEVETPATILVHAVCPLCKLSVSIVVALEPVLTVDATSRQIKVKASGKAAAHVCGQVSMTRDAALLADGQMTMGEVVGKTTKVLELTREIDIDDAREAYTDLLDDASGEDRCGAEIDDPDAEKVEAGERAYFRCGREVDHEPDTHVDALARVAWYYVDRIVPLGLTSETVVEITETTIVEEEVEDDEEND